MKKFYLPVTLFAGFCIVCVGPVIAQTQENLTTVGAGTWYPPAGCSSFYVDVWGGGAGGNTSSMNFCCSFQNGYGGGTGASFSRSITYNVTDATRASGYPYNVGAGGNTGADGSPSNFWGVWASGGVTNGKSRLKYTGGDIAISAFGGFGGLSFKSITTTIGQGGGGGSSRTDGTAGNGEDGGDAGYNGNGGAGAGNGGRNNSTFPTAPGGGGAGNQSGARGEIRIFWTCANYSPGSIGNAHTVPYPAEMPAGTDVITNVQSATSGLGLAYSWERSVDNVNWFAISNSSQATYAIPDTLSVNTYFRRVVNGCKPNPADNRSNVVLITVFSQGNGKKNGTISGRVTSKNGTTGVANIQMQAKRTTPVKGSPTNYTRTIMTDVDGNYQFQNLFYGDLNNGDSVAARFVITPVKANHVFVPVEKATIISNTNATSPGNNFTDNTVYSISGQITQTCSGCLDANNLPANITKGFGGAKISRGLGLDAYSDSINSNTLGYYATTVDDPISYTFTPSYLNHTFSPPSSTITVSTDVSNFNFANTTTRNISGKLTDVSGNYIGYGSLIFQGRTRDGSILTFKKRAIVEPNTGNYTVSLPAGSNYKVTLETFTPGFPANDDRYIPQNDVIDFFNNRAIEPAFDINFKDSVRNLVYHRRPVIVMTGLKDTACNVDPVKNPGIVFRTNAPAYFQVSVFEGPASLGDRVSTTSANLKADTLSDYLRIFTNVTKRSATANADTMYLRLKKSGVLPMLDTFLLPGAPNTVGDHTKPFRLNYIDRYGRAATPLTPKSTVVGVFNPTKTFTTAFPEIPRLILHAPPGDQSYSYWSKDSTSETATSVSVLKENGTDGFVNVSLGPTLGLEDPISGISFDIQVIATGNYTHEYHVNSGTNDEIVETTTTNQRFQTAKSGLVTGNSGDVYIGTGTNYILGKSIYVDFIPGKPFGACEIAVDEKLVMAPQGIRTEFAYSEDHIVNVIIPQQQQLAQDAPTDTARANALSQVSVWQQVIENNRNSKKNAVFSRNRSFSNGVIFDESETNSKTTTNTITYDVLLGNNIAFELGFRAAGVGVSGGAMITMRETTGSSTVTSRNRSITMGYHLEDNDPGDFYSVDIKKDPVYGTPVFDLVAGTSSCPPEEGAQNRDQPQIISGDMKFDNLDVNTSKFFNISLANKSESSEGRWYVLSSDQYTGAGLTISLDGINLKNTAGIPIFIPYGISKDFEIEVKKTNPGNKTLSYPDVEFYLSDNCGGPFVPNTYNTAKISFNYLSACGSINLVSPKNDWLVNSQSPVTIPVTMNGYNLPNINSVTLEYSKKGSKVWNIGFTLAKANITDPNSFSYPWSVAGLGDGRYELRLKLVCVNQDSLYTDVVAGLLDRKAPALVGKPLPGVVYMPGASEISFTYDENIDNKNLNNGTIELMNWTTKTILPITATATNSKLTINPVNSLGNTQDSFRVIVRNVADLFGNIKYQPDTTYFRLVTAPVPLYAGNNRATVHIVNPLLPEDGNGKMEMHFRLWDKQTPARISKIYFNLSGTALPGIDYQISYDTIKQTKTGKAVNGITDTTYTLGYPNEFTGGAGYVNIDADKKEVIIYLNPKPDYEVEGNETIRIDLIAGPDYKLQDSVTAIGTILNSVSPCPTGNTLYVNANATGNKSGGSWLNAMTSLKDALVFSGSCPGITQIWVAKGTYKPTSNFNRDSAFVMKNNLAIYGGFAGTETLLSQRNLRVNKTILSGDIGLPNNFSDNSYSVIRNIGNGLNATAVLDGFTVTGGNANKGDYYGNRGGAVHNNLSLPTFRNCVFTGNNAAEYGGAMFNQDASPLVINSVFAGNTALYGAGLYNESAATEVINCTFAGNQVWATGAAMYTYGNVSPKVTNTIMWGNNSGIQNNLGTPIVTNSIVQGATVYLPQDSIFILKPVPGLGNIGDLRLRPCSPALNAGSNAALPAGTTLDVLGNTRIVQSTVDIGAYERQATGGAVVYVDSAAVGNNDGSSWTNAYNSINDAINDLNYCANTNIAGTINIAKGTYTVPANVNPALLNRLNAVILGGYPTGGGVRNAGLNKVTVITNIHVKQSLQVDGIVFVKPPAP